MGQKARSLNAIRSMVKDQRTFIQNVYLARPTVFSPCLIKAGSENVDTSPRKEIYLPVLFKANGENVRIRDFFCAKEPLNLAFTLSVSIPKSNLNKKYSDSDVISTYCC